MSIVGFLRILRGKTHPQIKLKVTKSTDIWVVRTLNQLLIRGSYIQIKFSKELSSY